MALWQEETVGAEDMSEKKRQRFGRKKQSPGSYCDRRINVTVRGIVWQRCTVIEEM